MRILAIFAALLSLLPPLPTEKLFFGEAVDSANRLPDAPVVKGRLVDEAGQSVAGAEVVLSLCPADDSLEEEARWPAVSDAAGVFNFGHVSAGYFKLKAAHPDYADFSLPEIEIPGGEPDVDLGTLTLAAGGERARLTASRPRTILRSMRRLAAGGWPSGPA